MKHFSLGTVYATWSGMGIGLLALIGVAFFKDDINMLKVASFFLVIAGVAGSTCMVFRIDGSCFNRCA